MTLQPVSLSDRYDLDKSPVLLTGTQALIRAMLMQKARDRALGHDTAGYVTGYRGSPLGGLDQQLGRVGDVLARSDIVFQPGLNEDLAGTAIWGAQQAELRGEGRFDGVFGLWYGKGPGVDRSGDMMRHANMAGTSPLGGVVMALGDDHTGESSTTCHQSEMAMVDAQMPVISPAGVQEILDYALYGWALSRYAGVWAGLKLMKDTVEVTSVVDGDPRRMDFVTPDLELPADGLNIRLGDHWIPQEERLMSHKRRAAEAFARANRMDKRMHGAAGAKVGFVAAGKNWLDLLHAMDALGLDAEACGQIGLTTYKVAQTWPLDQVSFRAWADGLDLIVVVEEKRKLIEGQIKEALFDTRAGVRVYGARKGPEVLFPDHYALDPVDVAAALGQILVEEGRATDGVQAGLERIAQAQRADTVPELATRTAWFCSGCPHNTSTKVPDGARAGAGIGCHVMALWMDRSTEGYTHMGAEGANWIGESLFSTRDHVFQNIGEGTYNHSGLMAIRAAVAAGTTITYKILFNDAVAMTGGQGNDGALRPERVAHEVTAAGVGTVAVVYDAKEDIDRKAFPASVSFHERSELGPVQERLQRVAGPSVLLFIQTCAAEKRRRRKRGTFPDPDRRVFINSDVCEGCGDCGVQSNCVSIVPLDTPLGRKRAIDQSSCNKDFSCVAGFCPSFVTVEGGTPRKAATAQVDLPDLPAPVLPAIHGTFNVVITGVGGTGVVTLGAVLAMAAHLDGKGASMMEMAGLAQKGGAVHIHCRLANRPDDIHAIRVGTGECDALIGGDLVVSAGAKTLGLTTSGRTGAVVNSHEIMTGAFTMDAGFVLPTDQLALQVQSRLQGGLTLFDATELARAVMGDAIFANMIVFGAAFQRGLIPVTEAALIRAIELNGTAVAANLRAFQVGRWAVAAPQEAAAVVAPAQLQVDPETARQAHLMAHSGERALRRYMNLCAQIPDNELKDVVAQSYHKLLTYKDEYEVARLLAGTRAQVKAAFDGDVRLTYHLAPPLLPGKDPDGRPRKRAFGAGIARLFPWLARLRGLRGTPFDPFGTTAERRMERALITQFEGDVAFAHARLTPATRPLVLELLGLPMDIRGFGPVKHANAERAKKRRAELIAGLKEPEENQGLAAE